MNGVRLVRTIKEGSTIVAWTAYSTEYAEWGEWRGVGVESLQLMKGKR